MRRGLGHHISVGIRGWNLVGDSDRRARRLTCYLHLHGVIGHGYLAFTFRHHRQAMRRAWFVSKIRASEAMGNMRFLKRPYRAE